MKILFVLKDRFYNNTHARSYGLMNSANQVIMSILQIKVQTIFKELGYEIGK